MVRWEYKVVEFNMSYVVDEESDEHRELNRLGGDGWECIDIKDAEGNNYWFIFRREREVDISLREREFIHEENNNPD